MVYVTITNTKSIPDWTVMITYIFWTYLAGNVDFFTQSDFNFYGTWTAGITFAIRKTSFYISRVVIIIIGVGFPSDPFLVISGQIALRDAAYAGMRIY
jgi:hypothetical protein